MKKMVVIMFHGSGNMISPKVTLYDEIHDPIPYIKKLLKNWDIYNENFQSELNAIETVEDAQALIEKYAVYTMQVHVIDNINPEV